jgi:hypothetical protein
MNEKIKELAKQAGFQYIKDEGIGWAGNYNASLPKFAKLIVKECVGLCDQAAEENAKTFYTVTETKEVGPALVAKGSQVQAEKLSKQIKQHFGVE